MHQGATPPNVTLTGPFRHLIGTSLFGAMAHFVYCVTLSVQEIAVKAISYLAVSLPPNAPAEKHTQKNGSPSLCPDRKNLL